DLGVSPSLRSLLWARQCVCVPLIARDDALGVIIADNAFTDHPIGEREVEMLQTFANHAGLAIAAATAYKRLEEKVAELEETRDRLVRSERLAVVGRLAAHVAHEIRNPLATIGGFSRAILRATTNAPKVERNARIILEEVERLEQILANVMNFSKPGTPVLRERDLNESVEALCSFHENVFAERHIVVHKKLDPNCPLLRFDPEQIRQVLLNLCQNAIESMPNGGELTITTRALADRVEVVLTDTGQGMSESVRENLFQPFFTTKVGGTGLGLSVSQKIIHDHGGEILVDSAPGAGSSFTLSLPIPEKETH
ncbi:MAG TPA: ATP-binding protein, partial [Candidatus Brocadiia bacterium]|nr:ATP-binding protein [Candidatus Brocadiia bacterium]